LHPPEISPLRLFQVTGAALQAKGIIPKIKPPGDAVWTLPHGKKGGFEEGAGQDRFYFKYRPVSI
jgi:hypothetical protein